MVQHGMRYIEAEKMKIIIYILICFALMGIVNAITEGQIITQEQLDSINPDTVALNCTYDGYEFTRGMKQALFSFSCYDIMPIPDKQKYMIVRKYFNPIPYFIFDYVKCRLSSSKAVCVQEVKSETLIRFNNNKLAIREHIKSYQTTIDMDGSDFEYTSGDLN